MHCDKKPIFKTLFIVTLMVTLVAVFFVSGFPLQNRQKQEDVDNGNDNNNSPTLRGTSVPSSVNDEDIADGVFFVPDKANVGATLNPSEIVTQTNYYQNFEWDELPDDVQDAAKILGFTPDTWDDSEAFAISELRWSDLTHEQQQAAETIGYNQRKWNNEVEAEEELMKTDNPTALGTVFAYYYARFEWADLPADIQTAAEYLGYSEQLWDNSGFLPLFQTKWKDLTDTQRTAATALGFDEETWDDSSD